MKKTMNFLSIAALALVGAVMTSCSSDGDNIIDEPQQPENKSSLVTMTTTVSMEGASTRALTAEGVKTFAAGDKIAVVYKNMSNETVRAESLALTADDITNSGKAATFTVTLDAPNKEQNVTYIYPAAMAKDDGTPNYEALATQDGTLATLGSTLDYCTKSGAWESGGLPSLTLDNQLAILAITLKDIDGSNIINSSITDMTLNDGSYTYSITGLSSPSTIYMAIRPTDNAQFWISATAGTKKYIKTVTKTYAAGNGYSVSWRMATIGDVILSDGSFAKKGTNGAVAVITYVGDDAETSATNTDYKHGLALALSDANSWPPVVWCSQEGATCLPTQYADFDDAKTDMAGIDNTDYLINHVPNGHNHAAATTARNYNSGIHPTGTSAWFLASAGQWDKMITTAGDYKKLMTIANMLDDDFPVSSTELDVESAWACAFEEDGLWLHGWKINDFFIRAALAF